MIWSVFSNEGDFKMVFSGTEQSLQLNLEDDDQVFEGSYGPDYQIIDGQPEYVPKTPPILTQEQQKSRRRKAFQSEADPLFFKWQAGEGTKEDWEAKREEIRQRYPYPNQGE